MHLDFNLVVGHVVIDVENLIIVSNIHLVLNELF